MSSISQRYWRLCLLIYKGQGIVIDDKGDLQLPPAHPGGSSDFDEELIARTLKLVPKPIEFGLYRWSLEEDIMLLKAVPIMGRMFSEIVKRFIPHRDRGALRKRYQVLERRVKGALKRDKKSSNEIVRKKVAPLMEAISKKGPLPLSNSKQSNAAPATQHLRRYMNVGKQVNRRMPTLPTNAARQPYFTIHAAGTAPGGAIMNHGHPMGSSMNMPPVSTYNHSTSSIHPAMPNNVVNNILASRKQASATMTTDTSNTTSRGMSSNRSKAAGPASPSKFDSTSRIGFEKIMNGEYSNMSTMKHFVDYNDERNKDKTNHPPSSQQNSSRPVQYDLDSLPHFNFEHSRSGLSMLSATDLIDPRSDRNDKVNNDDRKGTSILSSVLGRTKDASRATPPPMQAPTKPIASTPTTDKILGDKDPQQAQSLDGFSFSNLRLPMDEDSRQTLGQGDGTNPQAPGLPPLTNSYLGTPTQFSQFPNAQSSYLFTNNSLIAPPQHEVDAAATLSQMSNSSVNFTTDILSISSPISPDRQGLPLLPEKKYQSANSSSRPSLFQEIKGRTKNK